MTLCWSRHQYVELVRDQTIATWLQCHRHAFEWFHGVPARLIIDNPKCAIIRACLYEPNVQRAYAQCAEGYGFRIDPCPPRDPQKKGIVESGVKYVKNSFGPLPDFRDLADANRQVRAWVMAEAGIRIHGRPGVPVSRPCPRPPRSRPPTPPAARPAGVASGAPARAPASARCQSTTRPGLTLTSVSYDRLRASLRSEAPTDHGGRGRALPGARSANSARRHAALLPGAGHRARGTARGHCGLHVQPWGWTPTDVDAEATDQSAGLDRCRTGTAALGLWWQEGDAGTRRPPRKRKYSSPEVT